jgi:transcriptional regulator with XRE-family HTH domain
MDIRRRIGWNVRRLRAMRGITQENFATDSGLDRGYVSGVERGVRNPSLLVLQRFAASLDVDISELFDRVRAEEFSDEQKVRRRQKG